MNRSQDRNTVWRTLAGLAMCLLTVVMAGVLDRTGHAARVYEPEQGNSDGMMVVVVHSATEAIDAWRQSGYSGRVLVHAGRYLHFVQPDEPYPERRLSMFPHPIETMMLEHAGDPGMLWVLMRLNIARELVNLLPADVYDEKLGSSGNRGSRRTTIASYGMKRTIADHFVEFGEPILLSMDASIFGAEEGDRLALELLPRLQDADLVICNLAEDNPRVTEAQREALLRYVAGIPGRDGSQ